MFSSTDCTDIIKVHLESLRNENERTKHHNKQRSRKHYERKERRGMMELMSHDYESEEEVNVSQASLILSCCTTRHVSIGGSR